VKNNINHNINKKNKSMLLVALFCVLMVNSVYSETNQTVPVCDITTLFDMTFSSCIEKSECISKFNINVNDKRDMIFFKYLVQHEMTNIMMLDTDTVCKSNDTYDLWIQIISSHKFCSPNELMDPDYGCLCKSDKSCDIASVDTFGVTKTAAVIVVILITSIIIYYGSRIVRELVKLRTKTIEEQTKNINMINVANISELMLEFT